MMDAAIRRVSLPAFPLPDGFRSEADYLRHLALEGLKARCVGDTYPSTHVLERLDEELRAIAKGYPGYLLIVNDYVQWARRNGLAVNADRGAVCGSMVAWALGMTEDVKSPLERGLRFESFVNPMFAEHWLPDIDLWVSEEAFPRIHEYVMGKYGKDHFAKIKDYPRGFVLCGGKVADRVPVVADSDGVLTTACPVREVLEADLCKFDLDIDDRHPIEVECLRETNGLPVYREQVAEIIHLMGGQSYAWALWAVKCLAVKRLAENERHRVMFVEGCLANPMFRQGRWRDADVARTCAEGLWESWEKTASRLFMRTHAVSGNKAFAIPTSRTPVGEVGMQDIAIALHRGERVAVLLRHAERPPLEKDDPTFGKTLSLTENGRAQAETLGFLLAQFGGKATVEVLSSDTRRCQETARIVARELRVRDGVITEPLLGDDSPYFGDVSERMKLADESDYRAAQNAYFQTGTQRGFKPLAEATDRLEAFIWAPRKRREGAQLAILVTHDINVASFLAGRKVVTRFEECDWPGFLDAAVCFIGRNGVASYGYMRAHNGVSLV